MNADWNGEYEAFRQLCRKLGIKCTKTRFAVYRFMNGNLTHPCVDEVWRKAREQSTRITRESVARILNEFAEFGIVSRLDKISNARFDSRTGNHGHLICEKCGSVTDIDLPFGLEQTLPAGFRQTHVELRVSGLCRKCALALQKEKKPPISTTNISTKQKKETKGKKP